MAKYSTQDIATLKKELCHTIDNDVLQIMLYGAYNAGKSTLINALLGRDAAKVKDIPTTFQVDQYDWNGYHLMDTPGVNAPIEHEAATEEQVKRSGIMIFVIREGDHDSKDLYIRLFKLLKRDKKVFIVLNHELVDQNNKILVLKKINQHLCTLAAEYSVTESDIAQISILPVNLRTACKAYSNAKHKATFLEHSGFNDFLQNVTQWIRTQDKEQRHIEILRKQIEERWYQPVLQTLEGNTSKSTELTTLSHNTSLLQSEKRLLTHSSTNYIAQQINLRKSEISSVLQNNQSQADLDSKLQNIFLPVTHEIEQWLSEQLKTVNNTLAVQIQHEHSQNSEPAQGKLKDVVVGLTREFGTQENLKEALLLGRQLKIPMLKGRWGSTLGGWAGKAATGLKIATFFYDIWKANQQQTQHNEHNRQQSIELYQAVEHISTTAQSDLTNLVHNVIATTFDPQIQLIQQEMDKKTKNAVQKQKDQNALTQMRNDLLSIV